MPEEEKPEGTPNEPEDTPPADSQPDGTPPKETEENWEQRYKDLQAESDRKEQRSTDRITELERQAVTERPPEEPDEDLDLDDGEGFVDRKTVEKLIDRQVAARVNAIEIRAADRYFRKTYPELVGVENAISGIMQNPKTPPRKGASAEERIDAAVKEYNGQTEDQKAAALATAEAEAKAKEEAKAKASGLGSTTTSTPTKGDEDVSDAQEIADRKAKSAKKRNLA